MLAIHTCIHTSTHVGIHIHTYVHACRHTYTNSYMHIYRHTYNAYINSNGLIYSNRAFLDMIWIKDSIIHCKVLLYLGLDSARNTKWTRSTKRWFTLSKIGPSLDTLHYCVRMTAMGAALVCLPGPSALWENMHPVYLLCCESRLVP